MSFRYNVQILTLLNGLLINAIGTATILAYQTLYMISHRYSLMITFPLSKNA